MEAGLPKMARVSQKWPWMSRWSGASVEALLRVSQGGEASDEASSCESRGQSREVLG